MTTLERVKTEIQKVLDKERDFTSENAKAQALALMWVLELIDKYAEQEPCEDAVSRQAMMDIVKRWYPYKAEIEQLKALPSVQPKQKEGAE